MTELTPTFEGGYFTSTGSTVRIPIRSSVDYFEVVNFTQAATQQATGRVVRSEWQRGFATGAALNWTKTNSTNAMNYDDVTSGGFSLVDTSTVTYGASLAFTAISDATPPVVSANPTTGLLDGDVVRIFTTAAAGAYQLAGLDFTIDNLVTNTSFELIYMVSAGDAAPGAGTFRKVNNDPMYYPRRRYITNITQATSAVVTLSVTHGYVVGEKVQFIVPLEYDMTQMNGLIGEITAIDTSLNTITVNIDTSGFTAFDWPRATDVPFNFAQVVPVGEIPTIISAATDNQSVLAMQLGSNVVGSNGDVLYWRAWKSFQYSSGSIPTA